jgi:hypothetical protein
MSKKPAKSERHVEIPDWAEDITPTDEVMKKFYAPTGSFQRGPIAAPEAVQDSHSLPPDAPSTADQQLETKQIKEDEDKVEAPPTFPKSSPDELQAISSESIVNEEPAASEPSFVQTVRASEPESTESPETKATRPARKAEPQPSGTQSAFFEDFARKWRQYLYPGQLSVMRTLYAVTYAVGTNECFTRYSEIARATKMSRRNCINVVNSLVKGGFIERVEVRNDATGKGIRLRIHLEPLH